MEKGNSSDKALKRVCLSSKSFLNIGISTYAEQSDKQTSRQPLFYRFITVEYNTVWSEYETKRGKSLFRLRISKRHPDLAFIIKQMA